MFTQIITCTTPNGLVLEKREVPAWSRNSPEFNEAADKAWSNWPGVSDSERDELEAALLAAAPLIRAAERARIREMADRTRAVCTDSDEGTRCYFADLIREPS